MFRGKKWRKPKKTVEERNRIRSEASKKAWRSRKLQKTFSSRVLDTSSKCQQKALASGNPLGVASSS